MDFDRLTTLLENTPNFGIIRMRKAPLILSFLHWEFKTKNTYSLPFTELVRRLVDYIELLKDEWESTEDQDLNLRARAYLNDWTTRGFLLNSPDPKTGEPQIELSSDTEKVFAWVDEAFNKQRFVGTDSRFRDIFRKLREVVEKSTEDPQVRLKKLDEEKIKIEQEIERIQKTGKVTLLENHQVEENFIEINRMARTLLADFKDVEKNFREIGKQIYEKQSELIYQKGAILGLALDAWSDLRLKPQGRSFYSFLAFLQSDEQKNELKELVDQLYILLDQHNIPYGEDMFLHYLKRHLHKYSERVMESNDKLSEKLNRALAEKALIERKRIRELVHEIRMLALKVKDNPPDDDAFIEVPVFEADIRLPLNRRLVLGGDEEIIHRQADEGILDIADIDWSQIYNQYFVDKNVLMERIHDLLIEHPSVTLKEVLENYPAEKSLTEIITYISIATQHSRHQILAEKEELLPIDINGNRFIKAPLIVFNR
ncbi:hypothetical protein BH09BAC5_BH09BAC5_11100 [soil metagenome]